MIDALTVAAQMFRNDAQRLNTLSQNLANVSTTGYKRQHPASMPFVEYLKLESAAGSPLLVTSLPAHTTRLDTRAGALQQTSNPLHVAIEGNSFFEVETANGLAYTKRGDFRLDSQGQLVTHKGDPVLGPSGRIYLNTSVPRIDTKGAIFDNDSLVGQIKLVDFNNPDTLVQFESGLFMRSNQSELNLSASPSTIRQGHLEASNVVSMDEMVRLIETMRHFESAQKIVQGYDEMMDKALKKLGEF